MIFSINIYEKGNPNAVTMFEYAQASSLNLNWNGSKEKLRTIVGTDLSFTMEVTNFQDAYFQHLNTQDERQFKVVLKNEENGLDIWSGHLLPDLYDEPYANGAFFVNFVATCGLGSLKDQYLPSEYYALEKTKIDVLATCLALTGLELEIRISPAIRNKVNPRWDENYIDTSRFIDKDKKQTAYEIIEEILGPLNCIFQEKNKWFIVGVNKFNLYTIVFNNYDASGVSIGTSTNLRDVKTPIFYGIPRIGVSVPRKIVSAVYDLEQSQLPKSAYKVENDGYVIVNDLLLVNHSWAFNDTTFTANYNSKDGKTFLAPLGTYNAALYIILRKPLLLEKGVRIRWSIALKSEWDFTGTPIQTPEELVANGSWDNLLRYDIFYTNPLDNTEVLLYSNQNGGAANDARYQLNFDANREASLFIDMIAPESAYYNIRLYRPVGSAGVNTSRIYITELLADVLTDVDEQIYSSEIQEVYTKSEEVELQLHDDFRSIDNLIRLEPLEKLEEVYGIEVVNGVSVLSNPDGEFIRLTISFLLLAINHKENITVNGQPLLVLGYVYNYLDAQEFLLQYDAEAFGGLVVDGDSLVITLKKFAALPSNISDWQSYTDDFYGVSYKRYGEVVVEVLRNLYTKAHPILSGSCKGFFSFLDLVGFNYDGNKTWYPLDVSWDLDKYRSNLILSQNFYGEAVTDNLPPFVDAGDDQVLQAQDTTVSLLATASDPDGIIVSVKWEVSPAAGVVFLDDENLATTVSGLNAKSYEFKITVTDDSGLTATDTMTVVKEQGYELIMDPVLDFLNNTGRYENSQSKFFDVSVSPPLLPGQTARITIEAVLVRTTPIDIAGAKPSTVFLVGYQHYFEAGRYTVNVLQTTNQVDRLAMTAKAFNSVDENVYPNVEGNVYAKVQIDVTAEIVVGAPGVFTNTPLQHIVEARK